MSGVQRGTRVRLVVEGTVKTVSPERIYLQDSANPGDLTVLMRKEHVIHAVPAAGSLRQLLRRWVWRP